MNEESIPKSNEDQGVIASIKMNEVKNSKYTNPSLLWLENTFKTFYFKSNSKIEIEQPISEREFGFKLFDGRIRRHLAFKNYGELFANVVKYGPSDIYCSSARYINPANEIEEKGWIGADLIFDIDGKDLNLPCTKIHNLTHCKRCDQMANGILSECSSCKSTMIEIIDLPCKKCISALKDEVTKLKSLLINDFGIQRNSIYVYFSGNNGFHIKVVDDLFFKSSSLKRRSYIQYLQGKDFIVDTLGFKVDTDTNGITILPNKTLFNGGWRSRLLGEMGIHIRNHKLDERSIKKIINFDSVHKVSLADYVREKITKFSVRIDPSVTMDVHRIFRLSGTINSKSGLLKTICNDLENFNPFVDACLLGDSITKIDARFSVKLSLNNKKFDIGVGINHVPEFVAIYLVLKGLGNYIEN